MIWLRMIGSPNAGARLLLSVLMLIASPAYPEIYKEIGPLMSLAEVQALFPAASLERLSPAWAQDTDALYKITGAGLDGAIVVSFYDPRPDWRREAETKKLDDPLREILVNLSQQSTDSALDVAWVRWVPSEPFPLERVITKYGQPERSGVNDSFKAFKEWPSKGVLAVLSDDGKLVDVMDFAFTKREQRASWQKKFPDSPVPDYLKETSAPKKKANPPQNKNPASATNTEKPATGALSKSQ